MEHKNSFGILYSIAVININLENKKAVTFYRNRGIEQNK